MTDQGASDDLDQQIAGRVVAVLKRGGAELGDRHTGDTGVLLRDRGIGNQIALRKGDAPLQQSPSCALRARIAEAAITLNVRHMAKRSSARWPHCEPSAVFSAATPRRPPDEASSAARRSGIDAAFRLAVVVQATVNGSDAAATSRQRGWVRTTLVADQRLAAEACLRSP